MTAAGAVADLHTQELVAPREAVLSSTTGGSAGRGGPELSRATSSGGDAAVRP
jgi:hypothetical protein